MYQPPRDTPRDAPTTSPRRFPTSWTGLFVTASLAALVPAAMWALHQPLAAAALLVAFLATVGVGHRYAETLKRFRRGRRFAEAVAARLRPPVHGPSSDAGGRVDPAGDRSME